MINTLSKTLGAQEKTQEIKQSPSMKIETKPYARSRRNELAEATGRWTGRWWLAVGTTGGWTGGSAVGTTGRWTGGSAVGTTGRGRRNRPDAGKQRPIEYREVPERQNYDQTRPVACDRTLAASDQLIAAPTVGT